MSVPFTSQVYRAIFNRIPLHFTRTAGSLCLSQGLRLAVQYSFKKFQTTQLYDKDLWDWESNFLMEPVRPSR